MKKFISLLCIIAFVFVSGCVTSDTQRITDLEKKVAKLEKRVVLGGVERAASNFYPSSGGLEGNGAGDLDAITGVADQDVAFAAMHEDAVWGDAFFAFGADDDNSTEAVPMIVDPAEAGNFRWHWLDVYGKMFYGYNAYKEITATCTFGSTCDSTLVRLCWGGLVLSSADDAVITLPEIVASGPTTTQVIPGASICVMNRDASENFILDCNSNDYFTDETGTKQGTGGHYIGTTATASSAGDFICVVATAADNWQVMGYRGTIVKE
jgi:hypothetical protein